MFSILAFDESQKIFREEIFSLRVIFFFFFWLLLAIKRLRLSSIKKRHLLCAFLSLISKNATQYTHY